MNFETKSSKEGMFNNKNEKRLSKIAEAKNSIESIFLRFFNEK